MTGRRGYEWWRKSLGHLESHGSCCCEGDTSVNGGQRTAVTRQRNQRPSIGGQTSGCCGRLEPVFFMWNLRGLEKTQVPKEYPFYIYIYILNFILVSTHTYPTLTVWYVYAIYFNVPILYQIELMVYMDLFGNGWFKFERLYLTFASRNMFLCLQFRWYWILKCSVLDYMVSVFWCHWKSKILVTSLVQSIKNGTTF